MPSLIPDKITEILPKTFYADRHPHERLALMVGQWQNSVRVIRDLEREKAYLLDSIKEAQDILKEISK